MPSKIANLQACINDQGDYLTVGRIIPKLAMNAGTADGTIVADAATVKTDLVELATSASPDQRAELQQYESALGQLSSAAQDASAGNMQQATESLTGLGPQLAKIPTLMNQICGS